MKYFLVLCMLVLFALPAKASSVQEDHVFYGLASYYNNTSFYEVTPAGITKTETLEMPKDPNSWAAEVGRFQVRLLKQGQAELVVLKSDLKSIDPALDKLRYAHLWAPLALLAKVVETSLMALNSFLPALSWGSVIVVFSVLLKIVLLPLSIWIAGLQRNVSKTQAILLPKLKEIKQNYDGEEAHNRIMAAHKEIGVTPFYALKPLVAVLIQVPILVAVFNALGEMPQLQGSSFLWIADLAYPDAVLYFPFTAPLFGNSLNLLPIIMTVFTLLSTRVFRDKYALPETVRSQKMNLYVMAAGFFVLFYPFPAAMVLYWALANMLQVVQQRLTKG